MDGFDVFLSHTWQTSGRLRLVQIWENPGSLGTLGERLATHVFCFLGGTWFPKDIKVGLKLEVTNLLGDKFCQLYDDIIFDKGHGWHFGKKSRMTVTLGNPDMKPRKLNEIGA